VSKRVSGVVVNGRRELRLPKTAVGRARQREVRTESWFFVHRPVLGACRAGHSVPVTVFDAESSKEVVSPGVPPAGTKSLLAFFRAARARSC